MRVRKRSVHFTCLFLQREEMPRKSDLNRCLGQFKPVNQPNREFINEYLIIECILFYLFIFSVQKVKKVTLQLE